MKALLDEALANLRDASMSTDDHEALTRVLAVLGVVLVILNRLDERTRER